MKIYEILLLILIIAVVVLFGYSKFVLEPKLDTAIEELNEMEYGN